MAYLVEYNGLWHTVRRTFSTRERAEQRARQAGVIATIGPCRYPTRFYRCVAYRGGVWVSDVVRCGDFLNALHFQSLMVHWSGCGGGPDKMRYEYSPVDAEDVEAIELLDHTRDMPHYRLPEFARTA